MSGASYNNSNSAGTLSERLRAASLGDDESRERLAVLLVEAAVALDVRRASDDGDRTTELRKTEAERNALRQAGDILRASIDTTACPRHGDREDGACLSCITCDQVDSAKEYDAVTESLGGESTAERTRGVLLDGLKLAASLRDLRAEVLRVAGDIEDRDTATVRYLTAWARDLRKAAGQ